MGVKELRDAWNAIATNYPASICKLEYQRDAAGTQNQVITVSGMTPSGASFEAVTDPHHMGSDPVVVVQELAKNFVESASAPPKQ